MKCKSRIQQTDRTSGGAEATAPAINVPPIHEELRLLRYRYTHIAQAIRSEAENSHKNEHSVPVDTQDCRPAFGTLILQVLAHILAVVISRIQSVYKGERYTNRPSCGSKDLSFTFGICVCGLLAFCSTLSANSTVFVLGNSNSSNQNYSPAGGGTVPAGPYAGTLTNSLNTLFFCLDGNLSANWDTPYNGTDAPPSGQAQEEAAFLASLMLYVAAQDGITVASDGTNESLTINGSVSMATFVNTVEGPISMAIWQIMGSLPTQDGIASNDPAAAPFVALAQDAWTNLLQYPLNPLMVAFNSNVMVFAPTGSTQRFVAAYSDSTLISAAYSDSALTNAATPEPGTMVLLGTGSLLIALGCARRLARRPL